MLSFIEKSAHTNGVRFLFGIERIENVLCISDSLEKI
jgi:hypothetical protein